MITRRMITQTLCFLLLLAASALFGCAKPPEPMREAPIPEQPLPPAPTASQPAPAIPPPTLAEARDAVARVYKAVVSVEPSRNPSFIAGDFNGDGAQDLAVFVKPAKDKLAEINSEVAGWMIRDALEDNAMASPIKLNPHASKTIPTITERDETLLVIIHGSGPAGWRDPAAQQSYLVKNAVVSNLRAQTKKSLRAASQGKYLPPLLGDVLNATMKGTPGFIYYTGASYGWCDPRREQAVIAKRSMH
jgi:hypothetical protein